jgi:TadE-like protein
MDRDRGAVMVEMAIVVPIFILLLFGMLEFGMAFKDKLAMSHAVTQATRNAALRGNENVADIEILNAFDTGLAAATTIDAVQYVDIFRAAPDGTPQIWDRYVPDGSPCGWSPCPDPEVVSGPVVYGSPADYPPCGRDTALDPSDGVDTIGVRVVYNHTWISGVLGFSTSTWSETARARIEPETFSATDPTC